MKRRGSSNRGRRNFETWKKKNPPAQPHRKAKIKRRQPLSPSLLQPRDPCRPPEAAQFSEPSGEVSAGGAVHQQPSRKQHAKRTLPCRGQKERKDAAELPPHPIPAFLPGKELHPQTSQPASTVLRGPVPHPCPSWGNPTLSWGQSSTRELRGLAWKDGGCRSRGRSPPDPTQPSLTACSGGGEAGPPLSPPAPPFG